MTLAESESWQVGTKLEAQVELSLKRSGEGSTLAKIIRIMYTLVITLRLMYKLYNKGFLNIPKEGYYIETKQCI